MKNKLQKGFTLIELMIVIAIIGILTALVTVNFQDARERARDVQRKSDLKAIAEALELYKNDQLPQAYPPTATWTTDLEDGGYIKAVPEDQSSVSGSWPDYSYTRDAADSLGYTLVACLENSADPNKDAANTCTSGYSYTLNEP